MTFYEFILQLGFWQWIAILIALGTVCEAIPKTIKAIKKKRPDELINK